MDPCKYFQLHFNFGFRLETVFQANELEIITAQIEIKLDENSLNIKIKIKF